MIRRLAVVAIALACATATPAFARHQTTNGAPHINTCNERGCFTYHSVGMPQRVVLRGVKAVREAPAYIQKKLRGLTAASAAAANKTIEFFVGKGYSIEFGAGIAGHLKAESNFNTAASGDGGAAHGIAQWHPDRFRRLKKYADTNGYDYRSFDVQLEYIYVELRESERFAYDCLAAAHTTRDATRCFAHFERPEGYSRQAPERSHSFAYRLRYATEYAAVYRASSAQVLAYPAALATEGMAVLSPPARFDHQFRGELVEHPYPVTLARDYCASKGARADACSWVSRGACHIVIPISGAPVDDLSQYRRHEIAHCNGWPADHPP